MADLERQGHNFLRSQEGAAPRKLPREVWSLGPVAKVPIDKECVAKEEEEQREQDACAAARLAAQVAALLSWQREEEQRQVAAREATRLATDPNEKGRVGPLSDTALIAAANPVANANPFSNTSPAAKAPTPVTKRLVAVEEVVSEP